LSFVFDPHPNPPSVIADSVYPPITNTVTASLMLSSGPGQGSKDTVSVPPSLKATGSYARASTKRLREDSDPDSYSESEDNDKADMEQMDFQSNATQYITETQAIGDVDDELPTFNPTMAPRLSPEHAAIRADFEIIMATTMEQLYARITDKITTSVTATFRKTTSQLNQQIGLLNARITQMQQQLLTNQKSTIPPQTTPTAAPTKKILKMKLEKKNTSEDQARASTASAISGITESSTIPPTPVTNNRGWETVKSTGQQKQKNPTPAKLIPTIYPQVEREVSCHFCEQKDNDTPGNNYVA